MSLVKDIQELVEADVISIATAEKIQSYYDNKKQPASNRLLIAFGILGALLVGLGIILIIAHNWDDLSKSVKTIISFVPLVVGQLIAGYTILKKPNNVVWRESSSTFLFFAVGASISMISQVYNIMGDLSGFLLTWMLLCLPLVYVLRSSITSLLFIAGTTFYACETSYISSPYTEPYLYWSMLLAIVPHYYSIIKKNPESNFGVFHHWMVPLSVVIVLASFNDTLTEFMFVAYVSLFGLIYTLGDHKLLQQNHVRLNSFKVIGSFGTIFLLLLLSFDWLWEDLRTGSYSMEAIFSAREFYLSLGITLLAGFNFWKTYQGKSMKDIPPMSWVFLVFAITFVLGFFTPIAGIMINLIILAVGILTIRDGAQKFHLGILNYGLLMITALVACRFFDSDLSFVIRGILFLSVGIGFFATNYWLLKNRNK